MSAGMRSGVNWIRERQIEDLGERLDEQRLRQAGDAGDQAVASSEQRHQHLIDDLVLADDDLAQLGEIRCRASATLRDSVCHCFAAERMHAPLGRTSASSPRLLPAASIQQQHCLNASARMISLIPMRYACVFR
jgi:hypothetical protein